MKLGRMLGVDGRPHLAHIQSRAEGLTVLDLSAAAIAQASGAPDSMEAAMRAGVAGLAALQNLADWAVREGEPHWFQPEPEVTWLTPVEVRTCIAAGRNFRSHRAEGERHLKEQGIQLHTDMPSAFAKLARAMVPTRQTVVCPADVRMLDYEVEVAAVIGRSAASLHVSRALDAVFGYTVLNDLSAREWQRSEMKNQMLLLGKNFPGFGPLGPWLLTADEVPDPAALRLELRVNGALRQSSDCSDLIHGFPEMIAHWSRMGLEPGDLITSGTPEGVAISRPDPQDFLLRRGDVVHASVAQIGTLETRIG